MRPIEQVILVFVLAAAVSAQDAASSLAELASRADAIARVRAISLRTTRDGQRQVAFLSEATLKGKPPTRFVLHEPQTRRCGEALFGIQPGMRMLAFLRNDRLVVGGPRSLVPIQPGLEAHVRALLGAAGKQQKIEVLASALASPNARVRRDSALALALQPGLEDAGQAVARKVLAHLENSLDRSSDLTPALLTATARLHAQDALDLLVPRYLAGRDRPFARLVGKTIVKLGMARAVSRIKADLPDDVPGRERAVRLLVRMPIPPARGPLLTLLRTAPRRLAIRCASALLRAGMDPAQIRRHTAADVLAEAQSALTRPPRFRSILRGSKR